MGKEAWLIAADVVVASTVTATIIRIDSDDPQAARTVAMLQGGCDAIGAFGERGLAIVLPDCPPRHGDAIARRLQIALRYHKVPCHVVAVASPRDGLRLADLLAVTEAELVLVSEAGREQPRSPEPSGGGSGSGAGRCGRRPAWVRLGGRLSPQPTAGRGVR